MSIAMRPWAAALSASATVTGRPPYSGDVSDRGRYVSILTAAVLAAGALAASPQLRLPRRRQVTYLGRSAPGAADARAADRAPPARA